MPANVIGVFVWGMEVGAIAKGRSSTNYIFEYDPKWVRADVELAPLQMPVLARKRSFNFPYMPNSFHGLPGMLSDVLPDDFGNALIDAWMATQGIQKDSITALDRLAYMGKRGMGALEFAPPLAVVKDSHVPLEMSTMVEAARRVLGGNFDDDARAKAALDNIIQVGTSAGGARAKAVIAWNPATNEIKSGQFDVEPGFEHWLLKFDGVGAGLELGSSGDYGRIEYAYHLMASAAGVEMMPCRLLHENGRAHFMTKRFDRDGNTKHHLTSLCAMANLDYKQRATHAYEQLFNVILQLELGDHALSQTFRRMAFNVMARNCDDHTKNFAFRLRRGGAWEISPAFDVTHAYNPHGEWTGQHLMSVNGKFANIAVADLLAVADRFSVPDASRIIDEAKAAIANWPDYAAAAGVSEARASRITGRFELVDKALFIAFPGQTP